jgi:hypothetical protein
MRVTAVLVLVALAIADVAWYLLNQPPPSDGSIVDVIDYALELVPAVVAILLPAVLLVRHPDVVRQAPVLLFGTLLFAVVQGMVILDGELQDVFATLTPPSTELPFFVPAATIFNVFLSLVTAFGVGYIAAGLGQARRNDPAGGVVAVVTAALVPVAAVFATIVGTVSVAGIDLGDAPMSPTLLLYLGTSVVLGIIRISVWTYLLATVIRGFAAGERPPVGWALAAVASALVIVALAMVNLGGVLPFEDEDVYSAYGYAIVLAYGLGHIALFGAFAVGLPDLVQATDDDVRRDRPAGSRRGSARS